MRGKNMCNFNKIIQYFIKLCTHTHTLARLLHIETVNWMLYACSVIWFKPNGMVWYGIDVVSSYVIRMLFSPFLYISMEYIEYIVVVQV